MEASYKKGVRDLTSHHNLCIFFHQFCSHSYGKYLNKKQLESLGFISLSVICTFFSNDETQTIICKVLMNIY